MRNRANTHKCYKDAALVLLRIFLGFALVFSCFPATAFAQEDSSLAETEVSNEETLGEVGDVLEAGETNSESDTNSNSAQELANTEFVAEEIALYNSISLSLEPSSTFSLEISGVEVSFRVSAEGEVFVEGDVEAQTPAIDSSFEGSLEIPEEVVYEGESYRVVGIGDYAFYDCAGLEQISIPEGVLSIGTRAFYRCEALSEIDLPETLEEIGAAAFFRCRSFTSLYIPASVKIIGANAFQMCDAVETLTFDEDCVLESIGAYTFACSASYPGSLTYVEFPEADTIPNYCFQYQTNLVTVKFRGESYEQMGQGAFANCTGLQYISIPELTDTSAPFRIRAFYGCTALTDVIWLADADGYAISTGSVSQSDHPFYGCTSITNVVSWGTRWDYSSGYGSGGGSVSSDADSSYPYTEAELHYYYNVSFYGSLSDAESGSNVLGSARLRDDVSILQINTSSFEEGQIYDDGGAVPSLDDEEAWLFEDGLVVDDTISESCYAYKGSLFDLASAQISFSQDPYYYNGASIDVEFTVTSAKGTELSEGTDFTIVSIVMDDVSYELDNISLVGAYTLSITGAGSYTGSSSAIFNVEYAAIEETVYEGDDIAAVAASVSSALYDSSSLTTVLLVPTDYPEIALVSSVYAAQLGWSVLFVEKDALPSDTATEIRRMQSTQVIVVGSSSLVDNDVITTISSLSNRPSVSRINASDSAEAAYRLWLRLGSDAGLSDASTVYLCASNDAASAVSAYAAQAGIPLLFCEESGQVSAQTRSLLKTSSFENMVVVGGTSSAAQTLSSIVGRSSTQYSVLACDGGDDLSIEMVERMENEGLCETSEMEVVVAGLGDAAGSACAALLAASLNTVMLLADNDEAGETLVDDYLSSRMNEISSMIFVGTEDGLSSSTRQTLLNVWTLLGFEIDSMQITRLAGSDRYKTMASIVSEGWTSSRVAVLVSGQNWPDALAASALAGLYDAPILLTNTNSLSSEARSTLSSLGVTQVYIVGGTAAVSAAVASQVSAMGISCTRIYGDSRVETAHEVYSFGADQWGDTAFVATSQNYADALSASSVAYSQQAPVFLVGDEAPDWLYDALSGFSNIVVLGGTAAVSEEVVSSLPQTSTITRLGGSDRYETSRRIAEYAISLGLSTTAAGVASGLNFPDALAGAALCGLNDAVVLLVKDSSTRALTVLSAHPSEQLYIFGGTSAVSASIEEYLTG